MRIFLQDPQTRLYCVNPSDWTTDEQLARHFKDGMFALHFCHHHHLPPTRMIMAYGDNARYDIRLMIVGHHFDPDWK